MVVRSKSHHRISRFSTSWVFRFETCYQPDNNQLLTHDQVVALLTSTDPIALLQAITSDGFENTSDKLRLYLRLCSLVVDNVQSSRPIFIKAGGIPLITRYMVVNIDDRQVQKASCRILAATAEHGGEVHLQLAECEVVEAVVDAIQSHTSDVNLQRVSIVALHNFSLHPANRSTMHVTSTLLAVVQALRVVMHIPAFVALAAATLASVVFQDDRSRYIVGENGAVDVLADALRTYPSKSNVQHACSLALQNIMWECEPNVVRFRKAEGMEALFAGLVAHPNNAVVIKSSLGALFNVVAFDPVARLHIISAKRWLIQICNVCKRMCTDLDVADHVIRLWTVLCECDASGDRIGVNRIMTWIRKTGTTSWILKWMHQSRTNRNWRVFGGICRLSHLLSLSPDYRRIDPPELLLNTVKGIEICLGAFDLFGKDRRTALDTLGALGTFLSRRDDCKVKFNNMDGVGEVVKVMKRFSEEEQINVECCKILDFASEGQLTAPNLLKEKEGLRLVILSVMSRFAHSAAIQENACSVLIKVAAISEKDAEELVSAGARDMVESAQIQHKGNPAVESLANQLLVVFEYALESEDGKELTGCGARSRSRIIEDSETVRARALKSRSPILVHKTMRLSSTERIDERKRGSYGSDDGKVPTRVKVMRTTGRQRLSMEAMTE